MPTENEIEAREAAWQELLKPYERIMEYAPTQSTFDAGFTAGATWKAEQFVSEEAVERLREFAEYIVWLNEPEASDARRVVTMSKIIDRAKFALSPEQAGSSDGR